MIDGSDGLARGGSVGVGSLTSSSEKVKLGDKVKPLFGVPVGLGSLVGLGVGFLVGLVGSMGGQPFFQAE